MHVQHVQATVQVPLSGRGEAGTVQAWLNRLPVDAGPSSRLLLLCECVMQPDYQTADSLARLFYGTVLENQG